MIHRLVLGEMFGSNVLAFGSSAEYTHMLLAVEQAMAALRPARITSSYPPDLLVFVLFLMVVDHRKINIWRAETLGRFVATQEGTDLGISTSHSNDVELLRVSFGMFPQAFPKERGCKSIPRPTCGPATSIVAKL